MPPGFWGPKEGSLELGMEGIKSRGSPADPFIEWGHGMAAA